MYALPSSITLETWRALLDRKRVVAILCGSIALLVVQHRFHPGFAPLFIGSMLCVATSLMAPLSFRLLFPNGVESPWHIMRLAIYLFLAVGVVIGLGQNLPHLLGIDVSFWTFQNRLVAVGLFAIAGWFLGHDISMGMLLRQEQGRSAAALRDVQQAQLLALRSHLDPHFLFNTLNAIAEWCRQDGEVAEGAVLRLAEMLRMVLAGVKSPTWPLAQEMELLQSLWKLHLLRDPNLFTLRVDAPSPLPEILVPPMILLPLAENAVKHGPAAGNRGEIRLALTVEGAVLRVTLENPGLYKGPRDGSDGVPTVERRLALAYAGEARLNIASGGARTTRVQLDLPVDLPAQGVPS